MSNPISLMLPQSFNDFILEVAEDWLLECYEENGDDFEPEYLYIQKKTAQILYGLNDLETRFSITEHSNGMVKISKKEDTLAN